MGIGDPLEAPFTLAAPLPAGGWTLVADGIVIEPVDVRFEVLVRAGTAATSLLSVDHHFEPAPGGTFDAVPFETSFSAEAAGAAGDLLVLRFSAMNATREMSYIPNGDGTLANGRIPFLDLP